MSIVHRITSVCVFALLVFSGCSPRQAIGQAATETVHTDIPAPTTTTAPSSTPLPPTTAPTNTVLAATPVPDFQVCSPLEGLTLQTIHEVISNPYNPPPDGKDDPHHGVDFGYYRYGERVGMLGLPVYAAISGTVVMVTEERFPYGYSIILETPLSEIPEEVLASLNLPEVEPLWAMDTRLYCPVSDTFTSLNRNQRSLYTLYAHLEEKPAFNLEEQVTCGQQIGKVGNSGNSINEHMHFEVRVGPSGARFSSMDHYDNGATDEEMGNYCTWRVSGLFKMTDPMILLTGSPAGPE